jgi:hydrogenase expression/formation protein HypE
MKDLTRGGLSMALNEWSEKSGVGLEVGEEKIPVSRQVRSICRVYGFDPFNLACEGRVVVACDPGKSEKILNILKRGNAGAAVIGKAVKGGEVVIRNRFGGRKILRPLEGVMLPRIC